MLADWAIDESLRETAKTEPIYRWEQFEADGRIDARLWRKRPNEPWESMGLASDL